MTPRSLHKLDSFSASLLKELFDTAEQGLGTTRFVYCELPILWVIDATGTLWFSIEEIVEIATREFSWPRLRRTFVAEGYEKLGHPALIGGFEGRIGGELLFDNEADPPCWYMTNRSGRYGLRPGRTAQHLANAAKLLAGYGIRVEIFFIRPKGTGEAP